MPCRPDSSALVIAGEEAFGRKQAVKRQTTCMEMYGNNSVIYLHTGGRGRYSGGAQSTLILLCCRKIKRERMRKQ